MNRPFSNSGQTPARRDDAPFQFPKGADPAPGAEYAEYDALADLFLADGVLSDGLLEDKPSALEARPTGHGGGASVGAGVRIEGLILGHLPVLASAWAAPYARRLADSTARTVGLVRSQAGQVSVDLFVPSGQDPSAAMALAGRSLPLTPALAAASGLAGVWLLRVDDASEIELAQSPHVSGLALLTGGDDAAVVASYRTLKGLSGVLPTPGSADPTTVPVRIAMVGTEASKAASAEQRIRRAAATFLGLMLPAFERVDKIDSSRGICVHRSASASAEGGVGPSAADIIDAVRSAGAAAGATGAVAAGVAAGVSVGVGSPGPRPGPVAPASGATACVQSAGGAGGAGRALALLLPGTSPIMATCPYADGVELAIGPTGLELLIEADGSLAIAAAVGRLMTASAWAASHASLLAAAHPALAEAADAPLAAPVMRLFTSTPKAAIDLLRTPVRVHLLAGPDAGGRWICRELN